MECMHTISDDGPNITWMSTAADGLRDVPNGSMGLELRNLSDQRHILYFVNENLYFLLKQTYKTVSPPPF